MKSKQKKSDLCKIPSMVAKFVIGYIYSIRIKLDLPSPSGSRTNQMHNKIYFPRSNRNAIPQIDHLLEVWNSSSLFVDPRSRVFRSTTAKPCKASGKKKTIHVYLNMNWSKLTVKEEIRKHHWQKDMYGKIFVLM